MLAFKGKFDVKSVSRNEIIESVSFVKWNTNIYKTKMFILISIDKNRAASPLQLLLRWIVPDCSIHSVSLTSYIYY